MIRLRPEPLTAAAFAPFGQVIEADHAKSYLINDGTTRRFHALAAAQLHGGEAILSLFRGTPRPRALAISMLWRHPLGSQAFIPLSPDPWLIVVAEEARPEACRAFIARGDQGAQYAANVWHHPLLTIAPMQDFLIVDRAGEGVNLQEHFFEAGTGCLIETP